MHKWDKPPQVLPKPAACESAVRNNSERAHAPSAGNICRSPSAEAVFKAVVERHSVADRFVIDSCGTGGGNPDWYRTEDPRRGWSYHEGDAAGCQQMQNYLYVTLRAGQLTSVAPSVCGRDCLVLCD